MSPRRVLLTAAAVLLAATSAAQAGKKPAVPKKCNGSAALCLRTFDQVVLAGAHNAMAAKPAFSVPNQQVGIPAQLKLGIRGLLIDTWDVGGKVYLCHVVCNADAGQVPFAPVLAQMAAFLKKHPGEVLLIVNEDHTTPAQFVTAVEKSPLKKYLYRGATGPWPTLQTMVKKNQRVVVLGEGAVGGAAAWYHPAYEGILQETPYSWEEEVVLTDPARQSESCSPNRGGLVGSLFLMNHWSPPFPASEDASARVNVKEAILSRVEACRQLRGRIPTIIAVDMVKSGDVVGAVKALNALPLAPATSASR